MFKQSSHSKALKKFHWRGVNALGHQVSGSLLSTHEVEVRNQLLQQKIRIKKIKARSISFWTRISHKAKAKDITQFTRQIATMLATGIPIIQAIQLIANTQHKAEMKAYLHTLIQQLESGVSISKALSMTSSLFDNFYCDLVATGEQSGRLSDMFERLATYREKTEKLRAKVVKAMIYPIIVTIIAISISLLMFTFVIPEFEKMFASMGAELPGLTQSLIQLSHLIHDYFLIIMGSSILCCFLIKKLIQHTFPLQLKLHQLQLAIPIIGQILTKAALARFTRTLATCVSSGIPILTSLETTKKTSGNLHYQLAIEHIHKETAAGIPIHVAMRGKKAFPEMVIQMIMIGEESGNLDAMLNKIADIYEFEVDNSVDNLGKIIEPVIILFLGGIIGGLVIALYLPIFKITSIL